MKLLSSLFVVFLFLGTFVTSNFAQPSIFGTGVGRPQTLTRSPDGDFYVVDTDRRVLRLPAAGGTGTVLATLTYSLRDGAFLPREFNDHEGRFLIVGGVASTNTPAHASTMDDSFSVAQYATQGPDPGALWSSIILPTGFGQYTRGALVLNQGSGQLLNNGTIDYFAPDGSVSKFVDLPQISVPYGGVQVPPGVGSLSRKLLVSDARSGMILSVEQNGDVNHFTNISLIAPQSGLRQMAFAPDGWGAYSRHLFVSISAGEVAVVNRDGTVVGKITGLIAPRGLLFTKIEGVPSLLIADTGNQPSTNPNGRVWQAGLQDISSVP